MLRQLFEALKPTLTDLELVNSPAQGTGAEEIAPVISWLSDWWTWDKPNNELFNNCQLGLAEASKRRCRCAGRGAPHHDHSA